MSEKAVPALIPASSPDKGKGRLASLLSLSQRKEIARVTLQTVVSAAAGAGFAPIVLTPHPASIGDVHGATVMAEDPHSSGLNSALMTALAELGSDVALVLHADLPLAVSRELDRLLADLGDSPAVTLVRSGDGGTNAMLMSPPGRFALAYGKGSFGRHVEAAFRAGLTVSAMVSQALALDLDTPADVDALLSTAAGRESEAGRLLTRWGFGPGATGA